MSCILRSLYFRETMKKCTHNCKSSVFPSCADPEEDSTEKESDYTEQISQPGS